MKEQRRSQRFRHELSVELHDKHRVRRLRAVDVARHGVFVATDDAPRARHLVQLKIFLPDTVIRAAANVTRVIAPQQALADEEAGAGLQFFALSDDDKAAWDAFILQVMRATPPGGVRRPHLDAQSLPGPTSRVPQPSQPPAPMRQILGDGGATFLVKLTSVERLSDFGASHLAAGGTVLFTPVLRPAGERVTLIVVHPVTDEEFRLPGVVARAHSDRPKRLEIHFHGITPSVLNAFRAYVNTGMRPSVQAQPQAPAPSAPTANVSQDFELDVDVFDEDTLDTDERIGQVPMPPPPHNEPAVASAAPAALALQTLKPTTVLVRCASCDVAAYAIDIGACQGALGLVADHVPFVSAHSGKVITAARLVVAEERNRRMQMFLAMGGRLNASVDLMTLLGAVALSDPATDPHGGEPLRRSRALERLQAAARRLQPGAAPAHTKVRCHACATGTVTVTRA